MHSLGLSQYEGEETNEGWNLEASYVDTGLDESSTVAKLMCVCVSLIIILIINFPCSLL